MELLDVLCIGKIYKYCTFDTKVALGQTSSYLRRNIRKANGLSFPSVLGVYSWKDLQGLPQLFAVFVCALDGAEAYISKIIEEWRSDDNRAWWPINHPKLRIANAIFMFVKKYFSAAEVIAVANAFTGDWSSPRSPTAFPRTIEEAIKCEWVAYRERIPAIIEAMSYAHALGYKRQIFGVETFAQRIALSADKRSLASTSDLLLGACLRGDTNCVRKILADGKYFLGVTSLICSIAIAEKLQYHEICIELFQFEMKEGRLAMETSSLRYARFARDRLEKYAHNSRSIFEKDERITIASTCQLFNDFGWFD
jgi:hypothetical protein